MDNTDDKLDGELEKQYGKPDSELIFLKDNKCEHFYIRKSASDIGCNNCYNGWIDNGKFDIQDGKIVEIKEI